MDYKYNRRYFETIHWLLLSFIILIGFVLLYFNIWIGILVLLSVAAFIFYKLYDKPTEGDIDHVYEEQAQLAIQKGFDRLNLHPNELSVIDPIVIDGPMLDAIRYNPAVFRGKDGEVRSSNYEVIVFYFSSNQMYYYKQSFSVIDEEINESFGEVFYEDIVSISTSSVTTSYMDLKRKRESFFNLDIFELHTSGGTTIKNTVRDLEYIKQDIMAMKDIIREKKSALS